MLSPEKVATPFSAAWVSVPVSVPLLGFVPIATVMFPVNPVAVLPFPSWAVIWTAGVIVAPATVFVGSTLKTSAVAVPGVMLNAALVEIGRAAGRERVSISAVAVSLKKKVVTPGTAAWAEGPGK